MINININPLLKRNPDYVLSTDRHTLQSHDTLDGLNQSVSAHMETLKAYSCKESIVQLLSIMSQHSVVILGVSYMSNKTMADKLGVTTRTIQRYIKELVDLNIITVHQTQDNRRRGQTSNTFVIVPFEPIAEESEPVVEPVTADVPATCHPKQSINLTSKKTKDHNNVTHDKSIKNQLILPTYIPERFAMYANLISKNEKDIVKLYNKVQLAYSKCALDYSLDNYLDAVYRVLKGVVYKVKYGKIKNVFGYFYRGVLATFDKIFDDELAALAEVSS
ncbi:helix-turn-helix domain-containing protein [Alkalihalobacillus sp. 1P02AB]|uniref:helix-turn-helix domain-containing protein n=1 Tax=Alkalihalobacillus sp. 1P02AB TaxID=3132260 RepID=UPI0039A6C922